MSAEATARARGVLSSKRSAPPKSGRIMGNTSARHGPLLFTGLRTGFRGDRGVFGVGVNPLRASPGRVSLTALGRGRCRSPETRAQQGQAAARLVPKPMTIAVKIKACGNGVNKRAFEVR